MLFSLPAILALLCVAGLALFPDAQVLSSSDMAPDRAALWFLLGCALLLQVIPGWRNRLANSREGATWVLLCAMFVLFQVAERAGPREGVALTLGFALEKPPIVSWATGAVVLGALVSIPLWIRKGGVERFVWLALVLVALFGLGMFRFLSGYFTVGETETLTPLPMVTLVLQIASYGALALCCRAAVESERARVWVLRSLPLVLLLVAARHTFAPIPAPKNDE